MIGKIHRLGLAGRRPPSAPGRRAATPARAAPRPKAPPLLRHGRLAVRRPPPRRWRGPGPRRST
ncbi:hypothetical protein [Caulobacter segnis]|uniref:hypothetical protein n=1 Tax=Caulobacter segnis TaxID=88688 RepID=UPI00350E51E4